MRVDECGLAYFVKPRWIWRYEFEFGPLCFAHPLTSLYRYAAYGDLAYRHPGYARVGNVKAVKCHAGAR